jgi:DNA invertase Pin-like site-specific DNA recombinase
LAHVGYVRVSTLEQDPTLQLDALAAAGCAKIFEDGASGARADRPGLRQALDYVRDGDVLIVWKLDRLGRSLPHLIETVTALEKRRVGFRSITEGQLTPQRLADASSSICSVPSGSLTDLRQLEHPR